MVEEIGGESVVDSPAADDGLPSPGAERPGDDSLARLIAAEQAAWSAGEPATRWRAQLGRGSDEVTDDMLDDFLERALLAVKDLLAADTVSLLVTNEAGDELVARNSIGVPERVSLGVRIPAGSGMAGHVLATRRPLVVDDLSTIELVSPMLNEVGVRSVVAVPVQTSEAVVGVLHAGSFRRGYFGPGDADALAIVANQLAAAMERVSVLESEREARGRIESFARRLEHLQRVTGALAGDLSQDEVADVVCQETQAFLDSDIASCALWQLRDDKLVLMETERAAPGAAPFASVPLSSPLPVVEVVRSGRPLWIESPEEFVRRFPETREVVMHQRRFALLPLTTPEGTLGALAFGFDDSRQFEETEKQFLLALAGQAGQALDRARLRDLEKNATFRNAVLAKVSAVLSESLDFHETLRSIVHLIVPELTDIAAIHLLERPGELVRVALAHRDRGVEQAIWTAAPEGFPGVARLLLAAARGESRLIEDLPAAVGHPDAKVPSDLKEALGALNIGPMLLIPLADRGQQLGVLTVAQVAGGRGFDAPKRQLLEDLAARAAVALTNSRLHSDLRDARRAERFLLDVTTAIAGATDYSETLERLGSAAVPALGDLCLIDLLDETAQLRRMVAHHADPEAQPLVDLLKQHSPELDGEHPSARVIRERRTLWSPEMPEDFLRQTTQGSGHLGAVKALRFQSYIAVPLVADDDVLGALTLVMAGSGRTYDSGDVQLAESLAAHVSVVVNKARRYDREHHTSQLLQSSLLPAELPDVSGLRLAARYLPGTRESEIGGDFYDAVRLPSGSVSLAIGDVAGHDHEAAAMMGHLRSALRALGSRSGLPSEVVGGVAEGWDVLGFDRIATCIVAQLDPLTGGLVMSNAGHPPPLRITGDGAEYLSLPPSPPLGAPSPGRRDWSGTLGAGETLLFYTDGVIDDRRHDLDRRMQQLLETAEAGPLAPDEVCDRVVTALGSDRSDDVALLAVERLPP